MIHVPIVVLDKEVCMKEETKFFYKAKEDVFLEPYNSTIPAGTLVVVFSIKRKVWETIHITQHFFYYNIAITIFYFTYNCARNSI